MNIKKIIGVIGVTGLAVSTTGVSAEAIKQNDLRSSRTVTSVNHDAVSKNLANASSYKWGKAAARNSASAQSSWSNASAEKETYKWNTSADSERSSYAKSSSYKWGTMSTSDQTGYRWGIRNDADQTGYRWGIRNDADQAGYRWGIRNDADQAGYRWGIR